MTVSELRAMLDGLPDDMPVMARDHWNDTCEIHAAEPPGVVEVFPLSRDNTWELIYRGNPVPHDVDRVRVLLIG